MPVGTATSSGSACSSAPQQGFTEQRMDAVSFVPLLRGRMTDERGTS